MIIGAFMQNLRVTILKIENLNCDTYQKNIIFSLSVGEVVLTISDIGSAMSDHGNNMQYENPRNVNWVFSNLSNWWSLVVCSSISGCILRRVS